MLAASQVVYDTEQSAVKVPALLKPLVDRGAVTVVSWKGASYSAIIGHCFQISPVSRQAKWLVALGLDEFITLNFVQPLGSQFAGKHCVLFVCITMQSFLCSIPWRSSRVLCPLELLNHRRACIRIGLFHAIIC
jgi:hypothetical protein